jgi:hypothetical protein
MTDTKVHVICCNDSVEYAVIDDERKAKAKLKELKNTYYENNKYCFNCSIEEYDIRYYWHIHTVNGE